MQPFSLNYENISRLSVPDFLTLLFDPYSRAQWDDFILKHADQAGNTSGPENGYWNITGESSQPERPQYGEQAMPEAWRDVIAERQRQINTGRTPEHDDQYENGSLALAAACYARQAGMWGQTGRFITGMLLCRTAGRGRVNTGNHPARVVTWRKRPR